MTKTNFTFRTLAEAEEAWETMRQYLYLAATDGKGWHKVEWTSKVNKDALEVMDRIASNVKENNGPEN